MNRLPVLAPALLLATSALAQDAPAAPEAGYQTLWCHIAFVAASASIPALPAADLEAARAAGANATPEQLELIEVDRQIQIVLDGIPALLDAASASYAGAGYTTEQFDVAKATLEPIATAQVNSGGADAEFTFEQCVALLPAAETTTQ